MRVRSAHIVSMRLTTCCDWKSNYAEIKLSFSLSKWKSLKNYLTKVNLHEELLETQHTNHQLNWTASKIQKRALTVTDQRSFYSKLLERKNISQNAIVFGQSVFGYWIWKNFILLELKCICDNDSECIHLKNFTADFSTLFHWNEKGGNFKRIKINNNNSLDVVCLFRYDQFATFKAKNILCVYGYGTEARSIIRWNSMNDFNNHFMTLFRWSSMCAFPL